MVKKHSPHVRLQIKGEVERARNNLRDAHYRAGFLGKPFMDDEEHKSPVDILLEEVQRTAAIVHWIESKMRDWADELIDLQETHPGQFSTTVAATNEALWYAVYQRERAHLAKVAKLAIDAGIDERKVQLAEAQTDIMVRIIDAAFDRLELSNEQAAKVPTILGEVIRESRMVGFDDGR